MKWFKWFLTSAFVLIITSTVNAQTVTLGRDLDLDIGSMKAHRVEFFSDFNLGNEVGTNSPGFFVYNEVANDFGTLTATGGEFKCLAEGSFSKVIGIDVILLGSSSIDYRVEGRFGTSSQYAEIASGNISSADATATDTLTIGTVVRVEHDLEAIRVGLKPLSSVGTDEVDVYGLFRGRY